MQLIEILDIRLDNKGYKRRWAVFFCSFCLQEVEKQLSVGKKQKSCGCQIHNYKHGETGGRLYLIWMNMKQRCYNINNTEFINYGGRDITICPEWANDYTKFRDWAVKNGYVDSLTIDRINNDGNYEPSNCHFVTRTENNRNTMKRNPYLDDKEGEMLEQDKRLSHKRLRREHRKNIRHSLNED